MLSDEVFGPSPSTKARDKRSARFWLVAHGIAWGLFLGILAFAVPRAEAIFADSNFPLPRQSALLIQASHWPFAHVVVLLVLFGVDWLMLKPPARRGKVTFSQAWPALMLIFPLLLIMCTLVVLVRPLWNVVHRLSG